MDWSKIKTIFIISFLILDSYLMYEFFKMQDVNEIEKQTTTNASIEKRLMADEIEYVTLPKGYVEDHYLKAKPKVFTDEDIQNEILDDQVIEIISDTVLESILEEPLEITDNFGRSELNSYIKSHVLNGDQYRFWERSMDGRTITYYQHFDGKTSFGNINGRLVFDINDDNEIYSYTQSYFEEVKELSKSEKIIQPINAIETLYTNGFLQPKSKITEVELGYYTLVPLSDKAQILNPAWCFVIDGNENLFVSAFEGKIIEGKIIEGKIINLNNNEKK
ncbi:two-component system regulatory protein YycI [Bacillus sp. V3B]|uniref:two-component system regulatory protein YycI n=1 Tax=Bacillus sp. V3B TaxID=2804915 RepID=UPI00210E2921|nr:two-component system regulatory protein YycI [Bacillus sp. V3B]MCQ6276671.1 two-component system regulatory protein YycI [Bacillus sp. V3B]